ncbi:hypothetical protein [Streptomyces sp. DSM 40907]|uniref:hypothetical protein n=1 Tax=Streptomyces kutzneri TaxID=3051179 RepID=UPI0028D78EFD|nr:hypothetical protein [Streptomyces sp. DSM 40907]
MAGARRAHRTLDRLHTDFAARGWLPYRPDVDHPRPAPHSALHRRLRDALDPHGGFSQGRFATRRAAIPSVSAARRATPTPAARTWRRAGP